MTVRAVLLAGLLALAGCGTTSGLGGGKTGGQTVDGPPPNTTGKASMVGGLITGDIGKGLGAGDRRKGLEAEYRALEYTQSGQSVKWTADSASGDVVPAQPYRVGSQDCRQYTHTVMIGGATKTARGTACRNTDGSWATLN